MKFRNSLRTKLALLMTGVMAALSLIVFFYIDRQIRENALRTSRDEAGRIAELTAFSVSPALFFDDAESASFAMVSACRSRIVAWVEVLDESGGRFASCSGSAAARDGVLIAAAPVIHDSEVIGRVRLALSMSLVATQIATGRRWLSVLSLLIFGVGVAAAVGISLLVTRPLRSITATAEAIRGGDLSRRTTSTSTDEVGTLARAFNLMLDELAASRMELETLNHTLEQTVEHRTREVTTLLQSTYDGIVAIDAGGRCIMINRSAGATLKLQPIQAIGRDLHALLHPNCKVSSCALAELLSTGTREHAKESFTTAEGSSISVDVSVAPMQDGEHATGTVMTFRDVTERDELQRQLDHATRLSNLGTLAAKMAHEFNNVLMGIMPFIELIRRAASNDPRMETWCNTIIQSVNRGKRITQEVLRFTRPQAPNRRLLPVAAWLDEFAPALRVTAGNSVMLRITVADPDLTLFGDREQLEQLLINLVSNSSDAMGGNGIVEINAAREGNFARISVVDDGPGMSPEIVRRVFEPFFTTKQLAGTGLGIPIAEQIVNAHGGSMEVRSAPGEGTLFHIRLPVAPANVSPAQAILSGSRPPFCARVLLVEDDAAVASGVKAALEEHGAVVELATSGHAALAALQREAPDAVVLDIGLPDIDGVALYQKIAARTPDLPVVFSTGHGDESALAQILQRPNVRFLLKPYSVDVLLQILDELVRLPNRVIAGPER